MEDGKGKAQAGAEQAGAEQAGGQKDGKSLTSKDYYFDSYAHFGIHEEMLKDETRTRSYQQAILRNPHLFKDKVVLDVGCGTGILSMFCATAGAKKVIGVDCSNIIIQARQIVKDNNFENVIELIQGKVEEIELPVEKVDVIVSEWMGYFLLYESMLDTVLYARDKWLVEGGLLFPDKADMYIAGIEDADYKQEKIGWWDNVYGYNFSSMKALVVGEPLVDVVDVAACMTSVCKFKSLDLRTCKKEDLSFAAPFELTAKRDDFCHALVAWFDCEFSCCHKPLTFSTGPHARYTHWKQTVFYLEQDLICVAGDKIEGVVSCRPNKENPRDQDIGLKVDFQGEKQRTKLDQFFRMR